MPPTRTANQHVYLDRPHSNYKHHPLRMRNHKGKRSPPPRPASLRLLSKYKKQSDVRIYVQTPPEKVGRPQSFIWAWQLPTPASDFGFPFLFLVLLLLFQLVHTVSATLPTRSCFLHEQLTNMCTNRPHSNFKHHPLRIRHHKGKRCLQEHRRMKLPKHSLK